MSCRELFPQQDTALDFTPRDAGPEQSGSSVTTTMFNLLKCGTWSLMVKDRYTQEELPPLIPPSCFYTHAAWSPLKLSITAVCVPVDLFLHPWFGRCRATAGLDFSCWQRLVYCRSPLGRWHTRRGTTFCLWWSGEQLKVSVWSFAFSC